MRTVWLTAMVYSANALAGDLTLAQLIRKADVIVVATRNSPSERTTSAADPGGERVVARWVVRETLHTACCGKRTFAPAQTVEVDAAEFERKVVAGAGGQRREAARYTPTTKSRGKDSNPRGEWIVFLVRTGFGFELAAVGAVESASQRATIVTEIRKQPQIIP